MPLSKTKHNLNKAKTENAKCYDNQKMQTYDTKKYNPRYRLQHAYLNTSANVDQHQEHNKTSSHL